MYLSVCGYILIKLLQNKLLLINKSLAMIILFFVYSILIHSIKENRGEKGQVVLTVEITLLLR